MIGSRLRRLRQARGMSLEGLAANLGGIITRQALWKYEQDKACPSTMVIGKLAVALDVRASSLWRDSSFSVRFVAYRKGSRLLKRDQEQIRSVISLSLENRLRLKECIEGRNAIQIPIQGIPIESVEEAEHAAEELRMRWNLGMDPIACVTDILEDHDIHVIEINANEKFDGISALAYDEIDTVVGAAVVTRQGIAGERQRLDLTHELAHLALKIPPEIDEEKAAFRFGAAFLAPYDTIRKEVGRKRACLHLAELLILKHRYGMSIQALLRRLLDVDIITVSHYRSWCIEINKLGYRKEEPERLPPEKPQWLRKTILHALAEELLSSEEAEGILGENIEMEIPLTQVERHALMKLPLSERRLMLAEQAKKIASHYEDDTEWRELQGGDIVEY